MWLCEDLGVPYELKLYGRDPVTILSPPDRVMALVEARLGEAEHLAGHEFTAADIMSVFSLTTMRLLRPLDLQPYPNILAYLQRIRARPACRRAMAKGDPDLEPMLS